MADTTVPDICELTKCDQNEVLKDLMTQKYSNINVVKGERWGGLYKSDIGLEDSMGQDVHKALHQEHGGFTEVRQGNMWLRRNQILSSYCEIGPLCYTVCFTLVKRSLYLLHFRS